MRKALDRAFWWIGLKLLTLIGCLVFFHGAAQAKDQCKPGWKYRLVRDKDGSTMAGCTDGKTFDGYVQMRDAKARLVMAGPYQGGQMEGVWKVYGPKGRVTKKVLMAKGEVVVDDYEVPDGDTGGGADD